MYNILILGTEKTHEYEELIKTFLPSDGYQLLSEGDSITPDATFAFSGDKNLLKYQIYKYLGNETGIRPPWGIVTGIRPVKLTGELLRNSKDPAVALDILINQYLVTKPKAMEALEMVSYQHQTVGEPPRRSVGIYVGIPFCPSRCAYCSFTSNQVNQSEKERYLVALFQEMQYISKEMKARNWYAETLYIGGGTPTSLNLVQLRSLLSKLNQSFGGPLLKEFSLEAGRPDTITDENMLLAARMGVDRISINPQSMHEKTLQRIGRDHTREQVYDAFEMARNAGIAVINTDIIAGLPGETVADFIQTLDEIQSLAPENITVHSLAMKRTSRMSEENRDFHFEQADKVAQMLSHGETQLKSQGYTPYYMYRQKNMAGSLENVGYCRPGTESVYNVRIMEENQTIIALGAGGISKAYDPEVNRLERIANVSNYEIYIERLDEMISRKQKDLFRRFETC